jgi:hypothetical protein
MEHVSTEHELEDAAGHSGRLLGTPGRTDVVLVRPDARNIDLDVSDTALHMQDTQRPDSISKCNACDPEQRCNWQERGWIRHHARC